MKTFEFKVKVTTKETPTNTVDNMVHDLKKIIRGHIDPTETKIEVEPITTEE